MKRFLLFAAVLLAVLALSACGESTSNEGRSGFSSTSRTVDEVLREQAANETEGAAQTAGEDETAAESGTSAENGTSAESVTAAPEEDPAAAGTDDASAVSPADDSYLYDVDLTVLNSTMIYSQVLDMVQTPGRYVGQFMRIQGKFSYTEANDREYFACVVPDATLCCEQGIEFILDGEHHYPEDYPEVGEQITVTGYFETYIEGTNLYFQLVHAELQ